MLDTECNFQKTRDLLPHPVRGERGLRRRASGIGLIELLVSLAISAALLTAIAFALDSGFKAYKVNQEQSSLMQRARLSMHRIISTVRGTQEHRPYTASKITQFEAGAIVTDSAIQMYDTADRLVVYRFDSTTHQLLLEVAGQGSHVLLDGVTAFQVKLEPSRSPTSLKTGGEWDRLRRATILLTIRTSDATDVASETTGQQTVTLSSSVIPRRNLW